jgi:hypothetical protein
MANEGSPANPSLSGAQILAKLLALGALGAAFSDDVFAIKGSADATKIARFEVDGLTTATTRVYTLPDASITVAGINLAQTFSATQTFAGIDATSIGATTRGTGLFTTLGANGVASFTNTTDASDSATAGLVGSGGAAFAKNLWVGANAAAGIALYLNCAAANGGVVKFMSANTLRWQMGRVGSTHDWRIEGYDSGGTLTDIPLTIANAAGGAFTIVRPVAITSSTASSSTSTGALIVAGGLGVGGTLYANAFNAIASSTINNTGGQSLLNIGDNAASSYSTLRFFGGSGHYNFQLGAQVNLGDTFEITPSSAAGNTTFGTPAFTIAGASGGDVAIGSGRALKLGNAYVATPPTCTGYVTLKDSAGTIYKVLVST